MTLRPRHAVLAVVLCSALVAGAAGAQRGAGAVVGGAGRYPLEPPDTSSPRGTLQSFLTEMNAAWRDYLRQEGSDPEDDSANRHAHRAARCFDLSEVPPALQEEIGTQTAVLLLDVFNRIPIPSPEHVPDADTMEREQWTSWTLPHTTITIARVDTGPRAGEWLFTPQVVERAKEFYRRTRDLPLKGGAVVEDGFEIYVAIAGWMIPVAWVEALPEWAQETYLEQKVWQWGLLIALLVVVTLLGWKSFHWSRPATAGRRPSAWRALIAPVALMLLSWTSLYLIDLQFGITGTTFAVFQTGFSLVLFLAAAWAVMLVGRLVAEAILSSPRIRSGSIDSQLVRLGTRLASFAVAIFIVLEGARSQGVPVIGVLAGLGVGGLAVALAAQSTIENFIGGLTLFADRPVRVGDFCRFGDQLGTVEQIGLRSTRIRTLDRSILTVPNAEFSRLQLDNLTRRDRILFRTTLNLRLETTSEQLQQVLGRVRELLLRHDAVDDDPARVRLVSVGPHSLDVEIFAYVKTTNWNEFLAMREGILVEVLREVEAAGTALTPPASATYLRGAAVTAPGAERG